MFDPVELPVMESTAHLLEDLRAREDDVDAHEIADAIYGDPLMTAKVFAHVASVLRGREMAAPETVTGALVLLGIAPFFRAFGRQPTVEERLGSSPEALAGFNALLKRAHRAADFALAFAVHRMDDDAHNIHTAALLHDLAEILLWLHAPEQALEIARRQSADRSLRSAAVQREVLHIELSELQVQLLAAWRLPPLLVALSDPKRASSSTAVRNVNLAIRVARHSANGWDDPALPDDVKDVSQLLQLSPDATWRLLRNVES